MVCVTKGLKEEAHSFFECILVLDKQHVSVVTK